MSLYGLLIGIAFAIGIEYFSRNNKTVPKNKESIFIILLFVFSIIGARTYSVISDWNYYSQNFPQIINTRAGGLGIFGGLIFGLIFIFIFSKLHRLSFIKILNTIAPIIPLSQSIGRFGNYFNHEIYSLNGQPVWLYESVLNFILFLLLIKAKTNQIAYYLIGYGFIRFSMEFLRWDTFMVNHIKIGQVLSLTFILFGILIIWFKGNIGKNDKQKFRTTNNPLRSKNRQN